MGKEPIAALDRWQIVYSALVVSFCVASGSLECGGAQLSAEERHGSNTYDRMCAVCHGLDGDGYKADHATALANSAFLASVAEPFLRRAIVNGRGGTTMSAWGRERGGPLSPTDVDGVLAFIQTWATRPRATLDERAASGNRERGAGLFAQQCAHCHGDHGTGGPYVNIGNPDFLSTASDGFLREAIRRGRPGTPMQGFSAALGDAGVEDVVAVLRGWQVPSAASRQVPPARPPPLPLGPVPLNPHGPEPVGFQASPATTPADVVKGQLDRHAKMALLDARAPSDYAGEHIAGAVSVPFYDPEPYVNALPRDAWLVCYCACPHAESGTLAKKLVDKGFSKVTVIDEGLGVWRSKKYPTHTGWDP
jgi:cytochrome c oxidase cbb3-type subunit 3/ubiquinol-cytochrome c reductase cytochrome c subunit